MAQIHTPVDGFTGTVVGVEFIDGVGETEDAAALAYFERHRYEVTAAPEQVPTFPEGTPTEKWTVDQLKAYASAKEIDLKGVAAKVDILLAVGAEPPAA